MTDNEVVKEPRHPFAEYKSTGVCGVPLNRCARCGRGPAHYVHLSDDIESDRPVPFAPNSEVANSSGEGFCCDRCGEWVDRPRAEEIDTCTPCRKVLGHEVRDEAIAEIRGRRAALYEQKDGTFPPSIVLADIDTLLDAYDAVCEQLKDAKADIEIQRARAETFAEKMDERGARLAEVVAENTRLKSMVE